MAGLSYRNSFLYGRPKRNPSANNRLQADRCAPEPTTTPDPQLVILLKARAIKLATEPGTGCPVLHGLDKVCQLTFLAVCDVGGTMWYCIQINNLDGRSSMGPSWPRHAQSGAGFLERSMDDRTCQDAAE
jgi:hypothetical protein